MSESCVFGKDRYIYAYVAIIAPFLINVGGRKQPTSTTRDKGKISNAKDIGEGKISRWSARKSILLKRRWEGGGDSLVGWTPRFSSSAEDN